MNGPDSLLIVGACTRAAAYSAARAGLSPVCVDFFADRDLAALCDVERVEPGAGIPALRDRASALRPSGWIYTGPLENHPAVVADLSARHSLLGNAPETLRAVRDPSRVAAVMGRRGLPCAEVRGSIVGLTADGSWLIKPRASGGGLGIHRLLPQTPFDAASCYCQRSIPGDSHAALYLAGGPRAGLVGVSRQLVGMPRSPFLYRGSIGPCSLPEGAAETLREVGRALASEFGLVGLFGVDFILNRGEPILVEVNPRYTASAELFELTAGRSLLAEHVAACLGEDGGFLVERPAAAVVGKAVLYANEPLITPEIPVGRPIAADRFAVPEVADVPWPGTSIEPGEPILTVYATGADVASCAVELERAEERWRRRLASGESRP